ncbi:MAG: hypothetical protein KDA89_15725, partial [Planctomycetaceae bacterium]|nr:hypothetical protein [Planctomycetaceae bacterium]
MQVVFTRIRPATCRADTFDHSGNVMRLLQQQVNLYSAITIFAISLCAACAAVGAESAVDSTGDSGENSRGEAETHGPRPSPTARVLSEIFAEQHAEATAFDVHQRVMRLPVEERFHELVKWVLPGEDHPTLRLQTAFTPTGPGTMEFIPETAGLLPNADSHGALIVSPLLDLIHAARDIGRLEELRQRLSAIAVPSAGLGGDHRRTGTEQQIALALIDLTSGRLDSVAASLEQILEDSSRTAAPNGPNKPNAVNRNVDDAKSSKAQFEPPDALLLLIAEILEVPSLRE